MGIHRDTELYTIYGSKDSVKSISARAASTLSRWSVDKKPLRGYNENTKELEHARLDAVLSYPDDVRMWKLVTEDGYAIELTEDSQVLTVDGWKDVLDIEVEDVIMSNGSSTPPYKDRDNLHLLYVIKGKTQEEIGKMYGVSARTIRVYIKQHGLQRGDAGAKFGEDNPNWKGDLVSKRGGYARTFDLVNGAKSGVCSRCGFEGRTDIHHEDRNTVNIDGDNLIEICVMCHRTEHLGASVRWLRPARIVEKQYASYAKTFGFKTKLNNVVANGFIVKFAEGSASVRDIGTI